MKARPNLAMLVTPTCAGGHESFALQAKGIMYVAMPKVYFLMLFVVPFKSSSKFKDISFKNRCSIPWQAQRPPSQQGPAELRAEARGSPSRPSSPEINFFEATLNTYNIYIHNKNMYILYIYMDYIDVYV